ncbi:4-hydroxy-tetrahydrodipicolinate reductase [Aminipila terrae]|uniref:4-hydroxy-tetrahydrodipicolinate reductase n=1 Tax=Aminipila terrae TaxID=2697030 RepID=A0A6P1MH00_9FIRM|nr:4-hydroxy-tetrahydrodipicolinate reductase [Aminipila terrae]QHI71854.1 4-hydroxy-tetrahydrodipicolinate reductase [Aminipila terrae]
MNIAIVGTGAMGKTLKELVDKKDGLVCVGMIEPLNGEKLSNIDKKIDIIIDFSNPANLNMIEEFARQNNCGVIIATTGYNEKQKQQIMELSQRVPIVQAANFSLGITVMRRILAQITPILKTNFDMEIIEKHHNKKLDSPSGTAKMMAEAMNPEGEFNQMYGRKGDGRRGKEIGIHAVRGGTIAGEHTVIFAGEDEILEIKHTAASKKIFALGALKAAEFVGKKIIEGRIKGENIWGLYDIEEVLFS